MLFRSGDDASGVEGAEDGHWHAISCFGRAEKVWRDRTRTGASFDLETCTAFFNLGSEHCQRSSASAQGVMTTPRKGPLEQTPKPLAGERKPGNSRAGEGQLGSFCTATTILRLKYGPRTSQTARKGAAQLELERHRETSHRVATPTPRRVTHWGSTARNRDRKSVV